MDAAELRALQESNVALKADLRKLRERQALTDASGTIAEYFRSVQVSEAIAQRVTGRVLAGNIPLTEAGDLDTVKVKQFAEAQLTEELEYMRKINPAIVVGMGPKTAPSQLTESQREEQKERKAEEQKVLQESQGRFARVMGFRPKQEMGRRILSEGRDAFDPEYNAREHGALVTAGPTLSGLAGGV